jgi:hypothetical protein
MVGKPEGRRSLGRPRCRWVDSIKMNLRETGWGGMDWIDLAQDMAQWRALVSTLMNLRVPQTAGKLLRSCTIGDFSRRAQLREVSLRFITMFLLVHLFLSKLFQSVHIYIVHISTT